MHIKIEQKVATAENLTSRHFEFRGRFWRDLKGSGVCFSNSIDFCEKIDKFDFARSEPEFDMKFTDLQN